MSTLSSVFGIAPQNWMQHHLPWMVLVSLMVGLLRDEPVLPDYPDEMNG